MKLTILHGGQTGVDRGAHYGALDGGLPIAGWMPRGKHDERGPIPDDVAKYLLPCTIGTLTDGYRARTGANVEWATHVCLIVQDCRNGRIAATRGTSLTWSLAKDERWGRPWIGIDPDIPATQLKAWVHEQMRDLIEAGQHEMRLLVAGPRASSWAAGEQVARSFVASLGNALAGFVPAGGGLAELPAVDAGDDGGFSPT